MSRSHHHKVYIKDPNNKTIIHAVRIGGTATYEQIMWKVGKSIGAKAEEILVRNCEGAIIDFSDDSISNSQAHPFTCQVVKMKEHRMSTKGDPEMKCDKPNDKGALDQKLPGQVLEHLPETLPGPRHFPNCQFREETLEYLKIPSFDVWSWNDDEMIALVFKMYEKLGLIEAMELDVETLQQFIMEVRASYRDNPFHNFRHAFCVSQMWYGLVHKLGMVEHYTNSELFCMLTAALCHDMDHPGYSNSYLVNSKSELAFRYNDQSPLENHHAATCFKTMAKEGCTILKHKSREEYRVIRNTIVQIILATDMAYHSTFVADWNSVSENFDPSDEMHRFYLMRILMKVSDISNEVRPASVSDKWLDRLLDEYFHQGDIERSLNLPTLAFMDRTKTTRASAQIGFISFVLIPFFQGLLPPFPMVEELLLIPVKESLKRFQELADKEKKEKE